MESLPSVEALETCGITAVVEEREARLDQSSLRLSEYIHDLTLEVAVANVIVEMQIKVSDHFIPRAANYLARQYSSAYATADTVAKRSSSRITMPNPVWALNILVENQFRDGTAHRVFTFQDKRTNQPLEPELLQLGFFELNKPCTDVHLAAWGNFFLNGIARPHDPHYLQEAAQIIKYISDMEEAVMNEYATKARQKWDDYGATQLRIGKERGITIGREEGISIGRTTERMEMARTLLAHGQSLEFVSKVSGIPINDLQP